MMKINAYYQPKKVLSKNSDVIKYYLIAKLKLK